MEKNIRLYPYFNMFFNCFFWGSIFFLFLNERVTLEQVLWLKAIYYLSVVILEVPSGYFSDHFGRKKTLLIASFALCFANLVFYFGFDFWQLVIAEVLTAIGYSFFSGTNHSFYYDSLKNLGREKEFDKLEAKATSLEMFFRGGSSFVGGAIAYFSLRYPYALNAVTSFFCILYVFQFVEPVGRQACSKGLFADFFESLVECSKYLKTPQVAWLFGFMLIFTVVIHVPFEFFQAHIQLLNIDLGFSQDETPIITGTIRAVGTTAAGLFAWASISFRDRFGIGNVLAITVLIEFIIILAMAIFLHPLVIVLITFRSIPEGIGRAPYTAGLNKFLKTKHRATFFSMNSLAGRLSFSILLLFLSLFSAGNDKAEWPTISTMLLISAGFALISFLILWRTKKVFSNDNVQA